MIMLSVRSQRRDSIHVVMARSTTPRQLITSPTVLLELALALLAARDGRHCTRCRTVGGAVS